MAQGAESDVDRLLAELGAAFPGSIESRTTEDYGQGETFAGFEVRR